ncbi:unnamed protein product [Knipowitschia caucasica]
MFHIVEFTGTKEVEVVPALWVKKDICFWPSYYKKNDLVKAIKQKESPGEEWEIFTVKILYTADTYKTARLKLPQAELVTDIHTEEDEEVNNSRRKRKRM